MDTLIKGGGYVLEAGGNVKRAEGLTEIAQQLYIQLLTPRGSFIYDRELGSDINKLLREKRPEWRAESYVRATASKIPGLSITGVETEVADKRLSMDIYFSYNGQEGILELAI